ncbi:MAG TPA: CAP domain-containing protein [Holophagaceae bacterium]|nr:CAP domain-containing protein [Holophagaceae bacterium]
MRPLIALVLTLQAMASDPAIERGRRVLDEINRARANPKATAALLRPWLDRFGGKLLRLEGEVDLVTQEGRPAVAEAIAFLESTKPLPPLSWSDGLFLAAQDHAREQADGATGHAGKHGSTPFERMERYGRWQDTAGEAIGYGPEDPRRVVLNLLVDDGVPGRGHRKELFNPEFHVAGAAFGTHAEYGHLCVIDFAGGFVENKAGPKAR